MALDASPLRNRIGGVGRYVEQLAIHLPEAGARPLLVTNRPGSRALRRCLKRCPTRIEAHAVSSRPTLRWLQRQAVTQAEAAGAQLLHFSTGRAALRCRLPWILTVHDLSLLGSPSWYPRRERWLAAPWLRWSIRRAPRIIAVSRSTRDAIRDRFPDAANRTAVIHEGAEHLVMSKDAERRSHRGQPRRPGVLDLPERTWLHVASMTTRKAALELAEAFSQAHRHLRAAAEASDPLPCLLLVGDAQLPLVRRPALAADMRAGRIRRMGYLPETQLRRLYRDAELCVSATRHEGFGLVLAEAMAAALPVIAPRVGAVPELCGDSALLIDPDDPAALQRAMLALAQDPGHRARLSEAGRRRALRFSWRACADRTAMLYRELLGLDRP